MKLNREELLNVVSQETRQGREHLLNIIEHVFCESQPERLLAPYLTAANYDGYRHIYVIAIGKAAAGLARAAEEFIGNRVHTTFFADEGHPLPTDEGVKKTNAIIKGIRGIGEQDLALVLLSGGGSAMFVAPAEGISLDDKRSLTHALLHSGATIHELNTVRKHLSLVKGGRLAQLLSPATIKSYVISDVIGNDLSTIASGPLTPDQTTFSDVRAIIKKYAIALPKSITQYLDKAEKIPTAETPKEGAECFKKVTQTIIADHSTTLRLAAEKARALGITTTVIEEKLSGEARSAAHTFFQKATQNQGLTIASGETTVTCCRNPGFGGRNQEFVLAALPMLNSNHTLASIGTDGIDGMCPTKTAGALADFETKKMAELIGFEPAQFLARNDSYSFFLKVSGRVITGPSGTNLGDLVLFLNQPGKL